MIQPSLQGQLANMAKNTGFGAALDLLMAEAQECVHVISAEDLRNDQIGDSRMGGLPDLTDAMEWPRSTDSTAEPETYATFLAQFNLIDVPQCAGLQLPAHGRLWFFIRSFEPERQVAALYDSDAYASLHRRDMSMDEHVLGAKLGSVALQFEIGLSLPLGKTVFRQAIEERTGFARAWTDLEEGISLLRPRNVVGQIGGFAYAFDGCDCARAVGMAKLGRRDLVNPDMYDTIKELEEAAARTPPSFVRSEEQLAEWKESHEELRPQAQWTERHLTEIIQWRLLVRFDPNRRIGFSIGDSAPLWVFIRESDLAARRFSEVEAEMGP